MSDLGDVTNSCQRCLETSAFFDTFFQKLSSRAHVVTDLFAGADEIMLKAFFRNALTLLLLDAAGSQQAKKRLARVRTWNGSDGLNLNPEWFPHWIESLMVAIRKHDPEYTPALEYKWRVILEVGLRKVVPKPGLSGSE